MYLTLQNQNTIPLFTRRLEQRFQFATLGSLARLQVRLTKSFAITFNAFDYLVADRVARRCTRSTSSIWLGVFRCG